MGQLQDKKLIQVSQKYIGFSNISKQFNEKSDVVSPVVFFKINRLASCYCLA